MSDYLVDGYYRESAAEAPVSARLAFIRRTYAHLLVAVLAFVGLEALLIHSGIGLQIMREIINNPVLLIGTLVLFIGSGFAARAMARSEASPATQYMGLALYVAVEVLIFLPVMLYCQMVPRFQDVPLQAGILTGVVFTGLSAVVFISKKDFSFLGHVLWIALWVALGLIIVSFFTPLNLGVWFSAALIAIACGYILYDTSNVLHHYPTNAHVAASLELFADVALLFYYIIRLMLQVASAGDN
jgi:FtsH-binding integral membrane protein